MDCIVREFQCSTGYNTDEQLVIQYRDFLKGCQPEFFGLDFRSGKERKWWEGLSELDRKLIQVESEYKKKLYELTDGNVNDYDKAEYIKKSDADIFSIRKEIEGFLNWYNKIYLLENDEDEE